MFIPQDKITEVQNTANIVEVISETVSLKKAGKDFQGLCPFHSEKMPSFTVSPEKQIFYCFGCGEGGNVFKFLMKRDAVAFPQAVRELARRYGIALPTRHLTPEQKRQFAEREEIFAVNARAAEYFHNILLNTREGARARAYLDARGLSGEIVEAFRIGYDPGSGEGSFVRHCAEKGLTAAARNAGLLAPAKNGRLYDRFWDRVVFPIYDAGKRVLAFGGRITDNNPKRPKYINSPETPVFSKKRSLYGLHRARGRCRESGSVLIAEGYLDLLALHRHGFENAVATLGTALTPEHVRMLRGFAERLILVYDSDEAGVRAAARSAEIFQKEKADACILVLEPAGCDPDSYLSEFGAEAFSHAVSRAQPMLPFLTDMAVRRHGLSTEGQLRILSDMERVLNAIADPVARNFRLKEIRERIGVRDNIEVLHKTESISSLKREMSPSVRESQRQKFRRGRDRFEETIVKMMLQFPEMLADILERDILSLFRNPELKAIGQILSAHEGKAVSEIPALNNDEEKMRIVVPLLMEREPWVREICLGILGQFEAARRGRSHAKFMVRGFQRNRDAHTRGPGSR